MFRVSVSVTTCVNSCHSTDSQFAGEFGRDAGLFAVITRPKHTPRYPAPPGSPKVRIAKSFWSGKISTTVRSRSVAPYFFVRVECARSSSASTSAP